MTTPVTLESQELGRLPLIFREHTGRICHGLAMFLPGALLGFICCSSQQKFNPVLQTVLGKHEHHLVEPRLIHLGSRKDVRVEREEA